MGDSSGSRTHAHLPNLDRNSDRCPVSGQPQLVQIEPLLLQSAARRFRCCSSLTFTSARTRAARNVAPRCDATISSALLLNAQLSRIRAGSLGHRNGTRANRPSQSSRPRSSQRSPLGSGHDHIDLPAARANRVRTFRRRSEQPSRCGRARQCDRRSTDNISPHLELSRAPHRKYCKTAT